MIVFLMYEHLVREWDAIVALKEELENRGHETYVFSIIYERNKALKMAKKHKPDAIIVPWFVDEAHEKVLYPFLQINNNTKVVNMHHEQIGSEASDSVFFPKTEYTKNGSYHLSWGNFFSDKLHQHGVQAERIYITGNIRNEQALKPKNDKKLLASKYHLTLEKPWILFAENRGYYLQRISNELRAELNHRGMSDESIDLRTLYEKKSLDAFICEMNKWNYKDQFVFIYRPHPGTYAPKLIPAWMHVIDDLSIYEWIGACDLFLTSGSTSIFEAEICNKPCANFDSIEIPNSLKVYGIDEYPQIKHANEINLELIEYLSEKKENKKPIYEKYLGVFDGKATMRTVQAIEDIMKDNFTEENIEKMQYMIKPSNRELLWHRLYEILTFFMTKTKLLYFLHFPKSAFGEAKDIPYSLDARWIKQKGRL